MAFVLPKKLTHAAAWVLLLIVSRSHAQTAPAAPPAPAPATPQRPPPGPSERLSDEAELQRVIGLYDVGKYDECARELDKLLDPKGQRPLQRRQVKETARIYHAACLIGSGRFENADAPLRDALRDNPQMEQPDALVFPRPVVERFLRVRQSMIEEIQREDLKRLEDAKRRAEDERLRQEAERLRLKQLESIAGRETIVDPNSRWLAAVPFGVGQFQNGDQGLGIFFFTSEVLALGTALTSLGIATHIDRQSAEIENEGQVSDANSRAQDWHLAGRVGSWAFLGLAALGIAEAQIAFVPETRSIRKRALPPPPVPQRTQGGLSVEPTVAVGDRGFSLGFGGRF